jgi:hypothetical protein
MKVQQIQTELKKYRAFLEHARTFVQRSAGFAKERAELIANHDFTLDQATCAKLASIAAGERLAEACKDRLLQRIVAIREESYTFTNRACSIVRDAQLELYTAMEAFLTAKLPDDIKDSVDVRNSSKTFQAEYKERWDPSFYGAGGMMHEQSIEAAMGPIESAAETLEQCIAELERVGRMRRKYATPAAA